MDGFGLDGDDMEIKGVTLLVIISVLSLAPVTYLGVKLTMYGVANNVTGVTATGGLLLVFVLIVLGVIVGLKWWNPGV